MRICFLIMNAYAIGGTVRATLDTASVLADEHDVEIVTVFRHREVPRFEFDPRVPVHALVRLDREGGDHRYERYERQTRRRHGVEDLSQAPSELIHPRDSKHSRFSLLTDARLEGFLRNLDADVLVGTRPGINLAIARWVDPNVFCVGQEHVPFGHHSRRLRDAIEMFYPRLDAVTALTEHDTGTYRELLPSVPVHHIPNMLPRLPARDVDLDRPVVVAGGRVTPVKGFDLLVDAWTLVSEERPDWELWIYGHGPSYEKLERQVAASPVGSSIRLHGVTPDLSRRLPEGSVFVLSSRFEGFGIVLLEAMGHGLPVVSFDCDYGPREIVTHDLDGLLVPPEDVEALAQAILRVVGDRDLRERLGRAAAQTATRYAPQAIGERWRPLLAETERDYGHRRRWLFGRPRW